MKGKTLQEMSCRKQNKNQLMLDKFEKIDKRNGFITESLHGWKIKYRCCTRVK
jgi:hypothetical protein